MGKHTSRLSPANNSHAYALTPIAEGVRARPSLLRPLAEASFLAPKEVKLKKRKPKLLEGFRVLQADACGVAFQSPVELTLAGQTVRGAENTVKLRVASIADFIVMKAHAIGGRDKPKDTYDLCYCLEHFPGGMESLAGIWQHRAKEKHVARAIEILHEKFASLNAFGPQQLVEFHNAPDKDTQEMQARRAFELVQAFLKLTTKSQNDG